MQTWQSSSKKRSFSHTKKEVDETPLASFCLQVVDACLFGILFLAPLFFGGRHLLGRFIFILLTCVAAIAWFTRQALLNQGRWTRSWANPLGLTAILLVAIQLIPLPAEWIEQLAPRNMSLLPLWNGTLDQPTRLGNWQTLSLTPSSTKIALATLIAYVLLFITVAGRLQALSDIKRLMKMIAAAVILMSGFGLLQYFTSNGLFFWFYEYPYTTTSQAVKGSFTTSNHFAHFVVLGVGPLFAWIALHLRSSAKQSQPQGTLNRKQLLHSVALHLGLGLLVLGVLLSLSRGGALALAVASTAVVFAYYRRGLLAGTYLYSLALLGLLIVGTLSLSGYDQVAYRLDDFTSGSLEELDSNEGRRKIWSANISAIQAGSLFGSGAGSHRAIYPVYLPQSQTREYTHAENGYLQVATENGWLGIVLLSLAIGMLVTWCWQALRFASSSTEQILAGALCASLVASIVHATVDFVWFIPSCLSLTVLLAACTMRLVQITRSTQSSGYRPTVPLGHLRWMSAIGVSACAAIWAITTTLGPAKASLHWDRYLVTSDSNRKLAAKNLSRVEPQAEDLASQQANIETMIFHLQNVVAHHPEFARAHMRLAGKYLQQFSQQQVEAENSMSLDQIREAALASQFDSAKSLRNWLKQAFGANSQLLYKAHYHVRKSLSLSPLQGKGYVHLALLCFLEGRRAEAISDYMDQGLHVRPYDGDVLFQVGQQQCLIGQSQQAVELWQKIYRDAGTHRLKIIRLLAGQMPAATFLEIFQPDWQTLRLVWLHYHQLSNPEDCERVLEYCEAAAQRECPQQPPLLAANTWYTLAKMQAELQHDQASLASSQEAFRLNPSNYWMRRVLGQKLLKAQRFSDAESHLRWCLARRPDDNTLRDELIQATKTRLSKSNSHDSRTRQQ